MQTFDVIIAGGGVAGLSAAVFLARAGISVALFDQAESSLYRVSKVNNYLGFPEGVAGPELLQLGTRQAQRFGAVVVNARVDSVASVDGRFEVRAGGNEYGATYLIIASNKRTDLATGLGLQLGGHGNRFVAADTRGQTVVPNCYAVGRITGQPSQAIISAGDGAKTAIAIIEKIRGVYYVDHDT
jgi:thioredoxin reductase